MSDEPTPNVPLVAPLIAPDAVVDPMDRRDFLRVAGVGAGAMLVTGCATGSGGRRSSRRAVSPRRGRRVGAATSWSSAAARGDGPRSTFAGVAHA
ncbi:MAG: twin-arginine translocation signal domain-containing protein [Gemmatimonadetes bacterium]|nr:twin-arginine translocation signal domain-containing protein [Gemmatimonadota bacterium]